MRKQRRQQHGSAWHWKQRHEHSISGQRTGFEGRRFAVGDRRTLDLNLVVLILRDDANGRDGAFTTCPTAE